MNPFATVIASHLRAQASSGKPEDRYRFKVDFVRSLYEKQWQAEQLGRLFQFIDWTMDLPREFELQFRDTLEQIEMEKHMPYVTSIERLARDEGLRDGEREGEIKGKIKLLQDLLGLPIMGDAELNSMTAEQRQALFDELYQRMGSR